MALLVGVCLILAATQWFFPGVIFRAVYAISIPFTSVRDDIGNGLFSLKAYLSSKQSLATENSELKNDISAESVKLLSMEALESENQSLQNIVAAKQEKNPAKASRIVFASVTARPPFSPYDVLIISSGENFGITVGNPVFSDNGTPIGAVENVFPSSAKILLFSSSGTEIPVEIGGGKTEVAAFGGGGGNFSLKTPVTSAPKVGDAVYIPDFAPVSLGVVENVVTAPASAFAEVSFAYPENIFEMPFVTVDTSRYFDINVNSHEATTTAQ